MTTVPNFFGPTRSRPINLGGSSTTYTQEALLGSAKQLREQRQESRRRQESASKLQGWWRGTSEARRVRAQLKQQFDTTTGPPVDWTRLLVFSWSGEKGDHSRLERWAHVMMELENGSSLKLFKPLQTPQADSWLVLLRKTSLLLLKAISSNPRSSHAPVLLRCLSTLTAPSSPACSKILAYLMAGGFYRGLSLAILHFPLEEKASPPMAILADLITHPFSAFPIDAPLYRDALIDLLHHIMTIPLLPNRFVPDTLARLSSRLPFSQLGIITPVNTSLADSLESDTSSVHLLANLAVFVPPRAIHFNHGALEAYMELLSYLMKTIQSDTLHPVKSLEPSSSWAIPDDSDEEDKLPPLAPAASRSGVQTPVKLDPRTLRRLETIPSPTHVILLLKLTSKYPEAQPQFFRFLLSLCFSWPDKRDDILSSIYVLKEGQALVKEIWRGWVRGSPLGKGLPGEGGLSLAAVTSSAHKPYWAPLLLFVDIYSRALLTMGDDEFFSSNPLANAPRNSLTLDEIAAFSKQLLNIAFTLYWHEDQDVLKDGDVPGLEGTGLKWIGARERITRCLKAIHTRDSRRKFTPPDHWLLTGHFDVQTFAEAAIYEEQNLHRSLSHKPLSKRQMAHISPRLGVLNNIPYAIPFSLRVEIFRRFVWNDMAKLDMAAATSGQFGPPKHRATVRRGQVAKDGYDGLNGLGPALKERVQITFVDQWGNEESGIDGGGVFKEFLTSLSQEAFDTDRGLWLATRRQQLYPNPHSYATEEHQLSWYRFIGRVLGKALYEGILMDVAFAPFFLAKWSGRLSFLDDLTSLDPELYQGLLFLKYYDGKVEDLALNFTVTNDEFGTAKTIELISNGANTPVTKENRLQYIHLVANYRLNTQIKQQSQAFFQGMSDIIDSKWLRMFNQQELQVLIGGTEDPINVDDLRQNTVYGGLYDASHPTIRKFWNVVNSLTSEQQRALLRFTTSCSRPPLLGFKELNPKFSIRDAGSDDNRLPTASTCVNLLKLPLYTNETALRRKLLQAIHSGAGFDLS